MLSELLDVLSEGRDAEKMGRLFDANQTLITNLTPYFSSPDPSPAASSSSNPTSSDPSCLPDGKELCKEVAQWTEMDLSHVTNAFNQLKMISLDSFSITTNQLFDFLFEERRRVYSTMIA